MVKQAYVMTSLFGMQFLAFLIAYVKISNIFLNPQTKLDKMDIFISGNFEFENLIHFDLV